MSIPTGTEATVLRKTTRKPEVRYTVGVTDPQWTQAFEETFDAPLQASKWKFSLLTGAPLVEFGVCKLRSFAVPPFQYLATREHAWPREASKPVKATFGLKFNQPDPIYSVGALCGGPNQWFGVDGDALDVIQEGSAFVGSGVAGRINRFAASAEHLLGYTSLVLDYEVLWDGTTLVTKEGGVTISSESDPFYVSAPRFWQAGWIHDLRVDNPTDETPYQALGVGAPVTLMEVSYFKTESNGAGYDTPVYPSYTTADLGRTVDTAVPYELFAEDGVKWFNLGGLEVLPGTSFIGPSRIGIPRMNLAFANGDGRFNDDDGWTGRPVRIDVRFSDQAGNVTAWRRVGIYEIGEWNRDRHRLTLQGELRVAKRMGAWMSDAFLGLAPDAGQVGEIGGVERDLFLNQIVEYALEWAETVSGGPLPAAATDIQIPSYPPDALDSGGGSVARFLLEDICDRLVQEFWVQHETSGASRLGKTRVHLWTCTPPATTWTVYGRGGASKREILEPGVQFLAGLEGPSQVFYRWNHPTDPNQPLTTARLPFAGQYPTGYHPASAPEHEDSMAFIPSTSLSVLAPWTDKDGIGRYGGIAKFRYLQENLGRRRISIPLVNHAWFEPGDGIIVDTSEAPGLAGEKFVVDQATYTHGTKNRLYATVECTSTDIVKALRTTVAA